MPSKKSMLLLFAGFLVSMLFVHTVVAQNSHQSTISFTEKQTTVYEAGLNPTHITLKRSDSKNKLVVKYKVGGDAVPDKDFEPLPGTLTFEKGKFTANIRIQPLTDYRIKDYRKMRRDRMIELSLTDAVNYRLGKYAVVTVKIINDPSPKSLPADVDFFSRLNLDLPELSSVKEAVKSDNYPVARKALAAYFRGRQDAKLPFQRKEPSKASMDAVLDNTYSVSGMTYTFQPNTIEAIDWSYSVEGNPNWSWEFNRFAWWTDLVQAYVDDPVGNEKYGKRVVDELAVWMKKNPLDVTSQQLQPGNRWRVLETASRLQKPWLFAFHNLKNADILLDDLLVDWVKCIYMHGRFLEESAEPYTNRGVGEATALFMCSLFFPEIKDAAGWCSLSKTRMENVLKHDVLPDGSYKELSPGYHDFTLGSVQGFQEMAKINNISTSPEIETRIQKMFDYLMYVSEPNGYIPMLNDSHKMYNVMRKRLLSGAALFPERKDYEWFVSNGEKGDPLKTTSHLFEDGGQVVMRSGWNANDNYLLMDAGPFGTSHGNEDKLSISIDGYGIRHIIDCGGYNYEEKNPFRIYSVSTHGKSAPLVDDLNQNRRIANELYERKSNIAWYTSGKFDYTAASYGADEDEVYGTEKVRPAITTRHIFYIKPDIWILIDAFHALDNKPHLYSTLFQCNDDELEINKEQQQVTIQLKPGEFDPFNRKKTTNLQPALSVVPMINIGQTMQVFKGQETPFIAGWQFEKSTSWKKQAIPTVRYDLMASGDIQMAYVLHAVPADKVISNPVITAIPADAGNYAVKISVPNISNIYVLVIAIDGNPVKWKNKVYSSPALIISNENGIDNITEMRSSVK